MLVIFQIAFLSFKNSHSNNVCERMNISKNRLTINNFENLNCSNLTSSKFEIVNINFNKKMKILNRKFNFDFLKNNSNKNSRE